MELEIGPSQGHCIILLQSFYFDEMTREFAVHDCAHRIVASNATPLLDGQL